MGHQKMTDAIAPAMAPMCWGADLLLGPDLLYGKVPGGSFVAKMTGIIWDHGDFDDSAVSKTAGQARRW